MKNGASVLTHVTALLSVLKLHPGRPPRLSNKPSCCVTLSTSVYGDQAATDRASCVISAGSVTRRRSVTDNVQTDSLVDLRSTRPGVPHVDRRGPTSPSDRSPRNSPRRRRRRALGRRRWWTTFWCCRAAEAAAAGRAGSRRVSTSRAGNRPPTSCHGIRDDSEQRRLLAGST